MQDMTKAVIGLGSIWGLFAFGVVLMNSSAVGTNHTAPEILALALYGLTVVPVCILVIWFRRPAANWLIGIGFLTAFGFIYQLVQGPKTPGSTASLFRVVGEILFFAAVPPLLGFLLLRSEDPNHP